MFLGETISLVVALSWTVTALFAEVGSKRMGSLPFNLVRMSMAIVLLAATLWVTMGVPLPRYADGDTWIWLLFSGVVGYVIGDYCLMQGYIIIGSRIGQLFMTLSAPTAALTGRLFLGEQMSPLAIIGMVVTLSGIAMSILSKQDSSVRLNLPLKGFVYASMAGICQGLGLVLSKRGMQCYDAAIAASGIDMMSVPDGAILQVPLNLSIPIASTMIRATMGIVGFFMMLMLVEKNGLVKIHTAVRDRKAMWCVLGSTIFGPFVGVSLSLMATLYTSTGIAQTLFALTPVLIIAPSVWLFHQRVTLREIIGAVISVVGVCLFFVE